jgi:NAD(P)-dependent dehydrogenase (short-subunit alcohol dehydrogenase family)
MERAFSPLHGQAALVTGAGRGIGRAIAERLAGLGATVLCVSRTQSELDETVRLAGPRAFALALDVSVPDAVDRMLTGLQASAGKLDILVHCAGIMQAGTMEQLDLASFDRAFAINVRAPYALTRAAMVSLKRSRGQILFVNSSIVRASNTAGRGVHAAAQAALKAIADSLRDEINDSGVRVLSIMPGRTATPREEQRCAAEGRPYRPDRLLQPEDVAEVACNALLLPRTAEQTDLFMRPMRKPPPAEPNSAVVGNNVEH